jgi:NAD-dependent SIR2 family protein deacetylase
MKSFIKESKRIIKQAMNNNKLIVFVGAGVSANSGYPLWDKVIENIAEKLGKDCKNISSDDYLKIPQYYFNSRKEKEYNDLINDIFNINNAKPKSLHSKILDLKPYHIITTNYDCLIEQAAAEKGMFYDIVCKDSDLPYTPNNKMIIKMHGDLKNKNFESVWMILQCG